MTNEKGWRMARANVCAREGSLYYEVRIVRGVPAGDSPMPNAAGPQPHVRMGFARREAPLDAPVGFDGYSYGVTDIRFETMHRSRSGKFFIPKPKKGKSKPGLKPENTVIDLKDDVCEGDVVGLEINLPSLSLHRKVVNGIYNPAVDIGDGFDEAPAITNEPGADVYDVIRDGIPVPYKGNVYFETMDYVATRQMEAYADRTLSLSSLPQSAPGTNSTIKVAPNPNHAEAPLRTLPHSAVRVYKNGQLIGTAFENLLAFLPPASAPSKAAGAREGFDDGMVGYFPAIACFSGGIAEMNFGEKGFWMPPPHLKATASGVGRPTVLGVDAEMSDRSEADAERWMPGRKLRPIGERYGEQIAEDIVWDVIDEVDFFMQDGGYDGRVGAGFGAGEQKRGVASLKEEID
jgi:COMPASS component BRE2